jgi:hypothetical protein
LSQLTIQLRSWPVKTRRCSILIVATFILSWPAHGASVKDPIESTTEGKPEPVSRDLFEVDASYVFESDLHGEGLSGDQSAIGSSFSYSHRFLLRGNVYLRLGISYDRFDFGSTVVPVPDHLQSVAGMIGVEYMHNNEIGAFIWVQPGFYTENDFNSSSFDAPITLGRAFVLQPDKLFLFVGMNAAFLRGQFPVIPLAGLIWRPDDKWQLKGVLPEPRLIYSPNEKWDFWLGGQLTGGSFRTDHNDTIAPRQLSNAQVDYVDYRAGAGLIYSPGNSIEVDLGGGCSIERSFDFYRADLKYKTDPAPYLRLEFRAKF